MRIFVGSDHGGFEMKEKLKNWLVGDGYQIEDLGAEKKDEGDDFVDYAVDVAQSLLEDTEGRGILLCRNGVGVSIVANRYSGVRCVLGFDKRQVEKARIDDDVNCLAIAADYSDEEEVRELVEAFLKTDFSGEERYKRRLLKLEMVGEMDGCGGGCCGGGGCGHC